MTLLVCLLQGPPGPSIFLLLSGEALGGRPEDPLLGQRSCVLVVPQPQVGASTCDPFPAT